MASWKNGPARSIGMAITHAVDVVGDADDYQKSAADLASMPAGGILGALVRSILEEQHPDGLDSDDIQLVLARCYHAAGTWTSVDANVLLAVLASALGIHEPGVTYDDITAPPTEADEWTSTPIGSESMDGESMGGATGIKAPTTAEYAWHAPILIADLLAHGRRSLTYYLDAAVTEIARAETMEMP
jgi:hypothetical protein